MFERIQRHIVWRGLVLFVLAEIAAVAAVVVYHL